MRIILFLLQKEFTQILRNHLMLRLMIAVPVIQLLILVPAVTFEIKNIRMCIVDLDLSQQSRALVRCFKGSPFFIVNHTTFSLHEAEELLLGNEVDIILSIPSSFEKNIINNEQVNIQLLINAVNGNFARSAYAFCQGIIQQYNRSITSELMKVSPARSAGFIQITSRYWYNEELNYKLYMAPGILVILVTAIGFLLCGLNLVREKEIGTSEQINVTPIKRYQFIAGKLLPFLVIALFEFSFGLTIAKLAYGVPIQGNLLVLFLFLILFLVAVLSLGLFMSTFAETQQQYLFIAFFFMMIFILMSGIFTPVESMPRWAQILNFFNPVAYFIKVNRMVLLKGASFQDISHEIYAICILGLSLFSCAIMRYRKTS